MKRKSPKVAVAAAVSADDSTAPSGVAGALAAAV